MEQADRMYSLIKEGNLDGVRLLLQGGYDPNQSLSVYRSPLEIAIIKGRYDIAKLLVDFGAELLQDIMVSAAQSGDRALFEYLLAKGADLNAINDVGHSALSSALALKNESGAQALIDLGIDLSIVGESALVDCSYQGNLKFIKMFIERGVDINAFCKDQVFPQGATPLIAAASGNQLESVQYLILQGADPALTDRTGFRAYNYARLRQNEELVDFIKSHEPQAFHDYEKQFQKLVEGGVPPQIIDVLGTSETRIDFETEDENANYLVLGTVFDVVYFEYRGYKLYNLLLDLDNYEAFGMITWCTNRQMFVSVDIEHEWIYHLEDMTWENFLKEPGLYIDGIINMDYENEDIEDQ